MKRSKALSLGGAMSAALLSTGTAQAQKEDPVDTLWCRSGTASMVANDEKLVVQSLDLLGVAQANDPKDIFHNATQRCVGTLAMFDGKVSGNGWCKTVIAKTGDWVLSDWKHDAWPFGGTWRFRHGTGALKGITGRGSYYSLGQTRPVETGTYQNCVRATGTRRTPG